MRQIVQVSRKEMEVYRQKSISRTLEPVLYFPTHRSIVADIQDYLGPEVGVLVNDFAPQSTDMGDTEEVWSGRAIVLLRVSHENIEKNVEVQTTDRRGKLGEGVGCRHLARVEANCYSMRG